jgi:transcription-repair coupling factor (superfamily II helicase)
MNEHELEQAMFDFVNGRTDVLVCTTIIESGLDIPNANTIFIHMADKYGLADLHQLRGRVGRYKHRAYCYLMLEQGRSVTSTGAKRLKAIEEFSELGAGFKIAMRDLEIRGAGNILGTEQSGHISSVGYELYCQLLENAVRGLTHEPLREQVHVAIDLPVVAYLPDSYIPGGRAKIEMYRKLSQANSDEALAQLQDELRDRFGPIPPEVAELIAMRELQIAAWRWKVDNIHLEGRFAVLRYRDVERMGALRKLRGSRLRIVDRHNAYLLLDDADGKGEALLGELKSLLQAS